MSTAKRKISSIEALKKIEQDVQYKVQYAIHVGEKQRKDRKVFEGGNNFHAEVEIKYIFRLLTKNEGGGITYKRPSDL